MKSAATIVLTGLLLLSVRANAGEVRVAASVPYDPNVLVMDSIKNECSIGTALSRSLVEHAPEHGVVVTVGEVGADSGPGRSLRLELIEAQSAGHAFVGHAKSAAVRGVLFDDGAPVATVLARRTSRGGAKGMFAGSCQVLDRTVEVIGSDLAEWLADPKDNARLGDF